MLLTEIKFRNFKSFGKTDAGKIDGLSHINLIFGHNSSGKSNILKFLNLLFSKKLITESIEVDGQIQRRAVEGPFYNGTITNEPFIFHKNVRTTPISFDVSISLSKKELEAFGFTQSEVIISDYYKKSVSAAVRIEGTITSSGDSYTSTIKLQKVSISGQEIFSDTGTSREYFMESKDLKGSSSVFDDFMGIFNDIVFFLDKDRYLVAENENSQIKRLLPNTFKNWLHNLSLDGLNYDKYEEFIGFVKKYGQPIDVLKSFNPSFSKTLDGNIDVLISNGSERLPISSFGTGIQQLLLLLAMIFETKSRIVLIEELELNLSPKSQQLLLLILSNLLADKKIDQVILTSHSEILASTAAIRAYEVSIDGKGITSVKKIEEGKDGRDTDFFERDPSIDAQMKKSYIPNPPGEEWE